MMDNILILIIIYVVIVLTRIAFHVIRIFVFFAMMGISKLEALVTHYASLTHLIRIA